MAVTSINSFKVVAALGFFAIVEEFEYNQSEVIWEFKNQILGNR
ncbi:MAG: hypothetical protein U1D41_08920 [Nitrosomonas sp.]|nr:hypothetical protein [Nitrosomonas sp.]MDP3662963.1 hypothetical protein [Nitrosomonas sp.]MDZ4106266.1 hypothetical protein [Nitrosomonas sp.]